MPPESLKDRIARLQREREGARARGDRERVRRLDSDIGRAEQDRQDIIGGFEERIPPGGEERIPPGGRESLLDRIKRANEQDARRRQDAAARKAQGLAPVTERELRLQPTIPTPTVEDLTRAGVPIEEAERIIAGRPDKPASTEIIREAEQIRTKGARERKQFLEDSVLVGTEGEYVTRESFEKMEEADQADLVTLGLAEYNKQAEEKETERQVHLQRLERFRDPETGGHYLVAALQAGISPSLLEKAGFPIEAIDNADTQLKAQQRLRRDFHFGESIDLGAALMAGRTNKEVAQAIEQAGFPAADLQSHRNMLKEWDPSAPNAPATLDPTAVLSVSDTITMSPRQLLDTLKESGDVPKGNVFVGTAANGDILSIPKADFDALPARMKEIVSNTQRGNPLALLDTTGLTPVQKDARYKSIGAVPKDALRVDTDEAGEPLYLVGEDGEYLKQTDDLKQFMAVREWWAEHPETGLEGAITHVVPREERQRAHDHAAKLFRAAERAGILTPSEMLVFQSLHGMTDKESAFYVAAAVSLPVTVGLATAATAASWSGMSASEKRLSVGMIALLFLPLVGAAAIRSVKPRGLGSGPHTAPWVRSVKAGAAVVLRDAPAALRAPLKKALDGRYALAKATEGVRRLEVALQKFKGAARPLTPIRRQVLTEMNRALAQARAILRSAKANSAPMSISSLRRWMPRAY